MVNACECIDCGEESRKERMGDALALGGEEGRGKLRKFAGICKRDLIREYPNGTTRQAEGLSPERGLTL